MPKLLLSTLIILTAAATPRWTTLQSGVKVRLRGISAVSDKVVWASGSNSTVLLVKGLSGYRSAVAYVPGTKWVVAVGPSGADFSEDDGQNWKPIAGPGFDTLSFIPSLRKDAAVAFGAGANGTMAKLEFGK